MFFSAGKVSDFRTRIYTCWKAVEAFSKRDTLVEDENKRKAKNVRKRKEEKHIRWDLMIGFMLASVQTGDGRLNIDCRA